jgi:HD superfamily phosphohydrolase
MGEAIEVIRSKGHEITEEESLAAHIAILLHDIGHGPFSHALEHSIVTGVSHERISELFMLRLSEQFGEPVKLAIRIFKDDYPKSFLHQLVSSQLDMDRLDYLRRDSFYSGVAEGNIGSERIIKMLTVHQGRLVVEEKGIYSIEKFIVARRLMYWQVYLHKTVLSAEFMLVNILKRAKYLVQSGKNIWSSPALLYFLQKEYEQADFENEPGVLDRFAQLDDYDILSAIKVWQDFPDDVLSRLCTSLINRKLFRIELKPEVPNAVRIEDLTNQVMQHYQLSREEASYFVITDSISNVAYSQAAGSIQLLFKDGQLLDAANASDHLNLSTLSAEVKKYFVCYPRF